MGQKQWTLNTERGVSLVELSIVTPLVLVLLAGTVNFASMILQMQVMSEAVRHSARTAAARSNDGVACSVVATEALDAFDAYLDTHTESSRALKSSWWGSPQVCLATKAWDADFSDQFVRVSISTSNEKRCSICFESLWATRPIEIESAFKLEWQCSGGGLDAC